MLMCSTASSWITSSSTTAPVCTMPLATNSLPSSFWYNRPITSVISLRSANLGGLIQSIDNFVKYAILGGRGYRSCVALPFHPEQGEEVMTEFVSGLPFAPAPERSLQEALTSLE